MQGRRRPMTVLTDADREINVKLQHCNVQLRVIKIAGTKRIAGSGDQDACPYLNRMPGYGPLTILVLYSNQRVHWWGSAPNSD